MTEYFSFDDPPEWGKKLMTLVEDLFYFFTDPENYKATFNLILVIAFFYVCGLFVKDITAEKQPIGKTYQGIVVGHVLTGEDRNPETITGITSEGNPTILVIPGEKQKKNIVVDIGTRVIEFNTDITTYYRTQLNMEVVVQMYASPKGWVTEWRVIEYGTD